MISIIFVIILPRFNLPNLYAFILLSTYIDLVHGLVVSSAVSLVLFSSARSSIVVIVIPIHPSSIHPLPSSPVLLPSPSTIVAPAVPVVATSPKGLSHYQR
ncbi:hypothetical protein SERLA73DRAFT_72589 [Serpula lacrymans var. lacrymans S7.3]|uniref:Uncharacterized protein n=1 Tax=Serpula lacrymans var. lacrymans (strain S7.3) TaxID=936435 RepID=F8PVI3_SERL3|nr:hypothetical protein SERLA73DRAFT_72589 [Serpula lacrymans var. lacrymans S7.3]